MKILVYFLFLISSSISFSKTSSFEGLPFEKDTTEIQVKNIPKGTELELDFSLLLPPTQKLNQGAGSFVAVYEKIKGENWRETYKMIFDSANIQMLMMTDSLQIKPIVHLKSAESDLAVFATIIHCGKEKKKTPCYIQGFRSTVNRTNLLAKQIHFPFHIEGKMK